MPETLKQLITATDLLTENQKALLLKFGTQLQSEALVLLEEQFVNDPAMVTYTGESFERKYNALARADLQEFNDILEDELEMIENADA